MFVLFWVFLFLSKSCEKEKVVIRCIKRAGVQKKQVSLSIVSTSGAWRGLVIPLATFTHRKFPDCLETHFKSYLSDGSCGLSVYREC